MTKDTQTTAKHEPAAKKRGRKRWILLGLGAAAAVVMIALPLLVKPPQPDGDRQEIARFVASPQFAQTPPDARAQYMHRLLEDPQTFADLVHAKKMPIEEKRRLLQEVFTGQLVDRADRFQKASPQDRKKLLDNIIADQERNAKAQKTSAGGGDNDAELVNRPAWTVEGMKAEIEHMPSEQRIKIASLMKGVADRRSERGMSSSEGAPVSIPSGH